MYHQAAVAALLSRLWRVRKRAQQTVKKLVSSLGGYGLAHGLLGELRVVINKHKVRIEDKGIAALHKQACFNSRHFFQILPSDVLQTETGELTEIGRSYVAPRTMLDALRVICSSAAKWDDKAEAEKLALDILIVTHHPSVGLSLS